MIETTRFGTGVAFAQEQVAAIHEDGFFIEPSLCGFVAHVTPSRERLHRLRELIAAALRAFGTNEDVVYSVELAASELVSNAIRAAGDCVPLVVEVYMTDAGVELAIHDPLRHQLPHRSAAAPDNDFAESGRGLAILDLVAPDWSVALSPIDKAVCCLIPIASA